MIANDTARNVPSSVYVSHSISTHPAAEDVDYFTAVDDLAGVFEETGSGHMGNISFDTACMYQFAYIDTDILMDNLKDTENKEEIARRAIEAILPTMILETPDGKQTTMASRPSPSAVLIEILDNKQVFDYTNAYAEPVYGYKEPIVKESVERLVKECRRDNELYGDYRKVRKTLWLTKEDVPFEEAETYTSLKDMVDAVVAEL